MLKIVKWFLLTNAHAKTIENEKTALTDVLLVGLNMTFAIREESITLKKRKGANIDNNEKYQKTDSIMKTKTKYKKKHWEKHINIMSRIKGIEEGNKDEANIKKKCKKKH